MSSCFIFSLHCKETVTIQQIIMSSFFMLALHRKQRCPFSSLPCLFNNNGKFCERYCHIIRLAVFSVFAKRCSDIGDTWTNTPFVIRFLVFVFLHTPVISIFCCYCCFLGHWLCGCNPNCEAIDHEEVGVNSGVVGTQAQPLPAPIVSCMDHLTNADIDHQTTDCVHSDWSTLVTTRGTNNS